MKHTPLFTALLLGIGCAFPRYVAQTNLFRQKHPSEAERYDMLAPTSVEYIAYSEDDHRGTVDAIIKGVEKRKDDPEQLAKYLDYLKRTQACGSFESALEFEMSTSTNRLQKGDSLCFFKYRRRINGAHYDDFGILVLRNGNIVYRSPWGWSIDENQGETNQPPREMKIDEL